jgi:hypothetical protein
MASKHTPGLATLERAYRHVWRTVAMDGHLRRAGDEDVLRKEIVESLLSLLTQGVTNPDELGTRALLHFNSGHPRNLAGTG